MQKEQEEILMHDIVWTALCENVSSGICGQRRPRSACASAQSDLGFHSLLTELLATTDPASILYFTAGRYRLVSYPDGPITARCRLIKNAYWGLYEWSKAHAQDDLKLHILRMLEGIFSLGAAQL